MTTEICAHCGLAESLHLPGQPCPNDSDQCRICWKVGPVALIRSTSCPHLTMAEAKAKMESEEAEKPPEQRRRPGRPKGTGYFAQLYRQEKKLNAHQEGQIRARLAQKGLEVLTTEYKRMVNRPNPPDRTISQCKDAALKVINQQIWNLEGVAEREGLTEEEEARLLKLLAGVNAALPKSAELPQPKPLAEMTDEEIKSALK